MAEEKEEKKVYEVIQVPTEHRIAIQTPEGDLINEAQLLVKMANDIDEMKKSVVG